MVGSGHVNKGAIYSIAGDSKWAGSAGFEVRPTSTYFLYIPGLKDIVEKVWNRIREGWHG
jgi:profilin